MDCSRDDPCGILLGVGDKITDPLFVDFKRGDYRLQVGSPARDAGVYAGRLLDLKILSPGRRRARYRRFRVSGIHILNFGRCFLFLPAI